MDPTIYRVTQVGLGSAVVLYRVMFTDLIITDVTLLKKFKIYEWHFVVLDR